MTFNLKLNYTRVSLLANKLDMVLQVDRNISGLVESYTLSRPAFSITITECYHLPAYIVFSLKYPMCGERSCHYKWSNTPARLASLLVRRYKLT